MHKIFISVADEAAMQDWWSDPQLVGAHATPVSSSAYVDFLQVAQQVMQIMLAFVCRVPLGSQKGRGHILRGIEGPMHQEFKVCSNQVYEEPLR
jgi:hypothetical protein